MIRHELIVSAVISAVYLILFASCEIIYRKYRLKPELTRKIVHFGSGIIAVLFPYIFDSVITIVILGTGFAVLLYIAKKLRILRSTGDVDRETMGEVYFPISILILFVLSGDKPVIYAISMLMLAIADPVGALIGKSYGSIRYKVQNEEKSLEGSFMFFLVAFIMVHLGLLLFTDVSRVNSILLAILTALLVTALESISLNGMDNLFIPVGTFLILSKLSVKSFEEVLLNVMAVSAVILISFILSVKVKKISFSGLVAIVLFGYASWMLASFIYYLVIVMFFVGFLFMNVIFHIKPEDKTDMFRVKPILSLVIMPFIIVFIANILSKERYLFSIFHISAGIQYVLLWRHWFIDGRVCSPVIMKHRMLYRNIGTVFSGLFIFLIPYLIYKPVHPVIMPLLFFIAVLSADLLYTSIRRFLLRRISVDDNRMLRILINTTIISFILLLQYTYLGEL